MTEHVAAKLHGGPMHGKRITVGPGCKRIIMPHLPHLPAAVSEVEPRPPWWRPLAWRRWRPPPIPEPPAYQGLVYRYLATDDRGLRIYAHDPYDRMPGEGEPSGAALQKYLIDHLYSAPPADRRLMTWIMSTEWWDEVKALAESLGYPGRTAQPEILLGLPARITDDGGIPHLVRWPDD